jgi:zinc protease
MLIRNKLLGIIFLTSFSIFVVPAQSQVTKHIPSHPSKLVYDSLKWTIPVGAPYRVELKNGLIAYIAQDTSLPIVKITGYVRYGSLADADGKDGCSDLLANLIRTGGTEKYPADSLDELIDLMAMKIGFSAGESQLSFSASFLSEYTNEAMDILEQMLFHPVFDSVKLDKEKNIYIQSIRHRFDNPGPTLSAAYQKMMYSGEAPGKLATEKSVNSICRKDLIALHNKIFKTGNMFFSMAGNFNRDSTIAKLEHAFPVSKSRNTDTLFKPITIKKADRLILVNKPISQAYVRIGLPLFKRPDPDYYPVSVLDLILGGGGFTSRLGTKVRSDEGLTYSIYSQAESNYTYPGTFYIDFYTKNESFSKAVDLTIAEVNRIVKDGVTDEELSNAKATLLGELPSMFRTPFDIVSTYTWNEYYGRSPDIFKNYPGEIKAVDRENILRVARKYLDVNSFIFTIVGDAAVLKAQIEKDPNLSKLNLKVIQPDGITQMP